MAVSVPRYTVDDLEQFPDDGQRHEPQVWLADITDRSVEVWQAPGIE